MTLRKTDSRRDFLKSIIASTAAMVVAGCTRETSFSARTIPTKDPHAATSTPAAAQPTSGTTPTQGVLSPMAKGTNTPTPTVEPPVTTPAQALNRLAEGNTRWMNAKSVHPNTSSTRRTALTKGQNPFAIIFSCIDSRVPPEYIFDRGIGDLLVIRTAGHALDNAALGSIEFGVEELKIPLVMVLGHEKCGAITAAVEAEKQKTPPPGQIKTLLDSLKPAVDAGKALKGDPIENAIAANIELTVNKVRASPVIAESIKKGKVRVVGALYDLDTGGVELTVL